MNNIKRRLKTIAWQERKERMGMLIARFIAMNNFKRRMKTIA